MRSCAERRSAETERGRVKTMKFLRRKRSFLPERQRRRIPRRRRRCSKDKKIVKNQKNAVKDEKEKEKPVAEEYSYYSTSQDPQANAKPAPKADDGKRKAKAMPKLASKKARGSLRTSRPHHLRHHPVSLEIKKERRRRIC